MPHREVVRIVRGAKTAVLMVHGIAGTPRHFDELVPLVPKNISMAVIRLDGHGGSVGDFSRTSMKKWKAQVEEWVQNLSADHERIIVVGHSMGTLLTARLVERYPGIQGMLLLNVPLKIWVSLGMMVRSMRFCFGKLRQEVPGEAALTRAAGVTAEPWLWKYLGWLPRFWELLMLCRECRPLFGKLEIPCHVFQSEHDELVRTSTSRLLVGRPNVHHRVMVRSGHFDYAPEEFAKVLGCFEDLVKEE